MVAIYRLRTATPAATQGHRPGDLVNAGAGYVLRNLPALLGRHPGVLATMQRQCRRANLRQMRRRLSRRRHPLQRVALAHLSHVSVGKAEQSEQLPECGVVAAPMLGEERSRRLDGGRFVVRESGD